MSTILAYPGVRDFFSHYLGWSQSHTTLLLIGLSLWSLIWKGFALWFAARNYQKKWFIVLLILNTLGIAEIIYLLFFRRDKQEGVTQSLFNTPLPEETDEGVASSTAS